MDRLYVLAIAILLSGILSGGVYTIAAAGNGSTLVMNRFTGSVLFCSSMSGCSLLSRN
jgi:hypothetical protein